MVSSHQDLPPGTNPSKADGGFDELILGVTHGIFSQALGKSVADVLLHNFRTREPLLVDPTADRCLLLQRILEESFGEFHSTIMEIVMEQVYETIGIRRPYGTEAGISELLSDARKAYSSVN